MEKFKRRFYDTHPELPLDPDTEHILQPRKIHTDPAHIIVVAVGGFFGTIVRYELGLLLPVEKNGWPVMTFCINVVGAFLLGLLLESLTRRGSDEGSRRVLRLLAGTGFLGAFTTYSSLAVAITTQLQSGASITVSTYGGASLVVGVIACALGIMLATKRSRVRV